MTNDDDDGRMPDLDLRFLGFLVPSLNSCVFLFALYHTTSF